MANLIFNAIGFGLRNLPLATLDMLIVWGTIIWLAEAIWRIIAGWQWLQLPYFVWVSLATTLQLSITWMNR